MNLAADFRHALRLLRRSPATTAVIVVTLALCIGANSAIFGLVDSFLLRPLPFPEPERLAQVVRHFQGHGAESDETGQTGGAWEAVRHHATFLDSAVYSDGFTGVNLSAAGAVQYVQQQRVGAGFFRVLGVRPLIGREFLPAEDRPGGPPLAILSFAIWKRVFRQDPAAVGKTLLLRGEPHTVVGVMPESFHFYSRVDLWTPLRPDPNGEGQGENYAIVGRLKPGVTWPQANSQLETVGAPLLRPPVGVSARLRLITLQQGQTQDVREPLLIVWASVVFVLLIGCANVAGLLLARAAARRREIATRMALGGGRTAIVRQLLVETLVLAILGGAAGLLVASFALDGFRAAYSSLGGLQAAQYFQVFQPARLDMRVLAATATISILVSILAGVIPAFQAGAVDLRTALSEAGGRGVAGMRKRWSRSFLVAGEIALSVMLLIGAGLLIRSLAHLYQLRPGLEASHVITASFSMQDARYDTPKRVNQFFESALSRMRALPGVEAAGAGLTLPYERALNMRFRRADDPQSDLRMYPTNAFYATPGYIEALRIPVLRGRAIQESDNVTAAPIVVVNEAFVTRYLSRQAAVGSHILLGGAPHEIVGVIGNVQQAAGFGNFGPFGPVPAVYLPVTQVNPALLQMVHVWFTPSWVVRTSDSSPATLRAIRNAVASVDPLVPIAEFRTLAQVRSTTLSFQRFQAILLGSLSALAFLLAIVGIYGLMANSVVERTREFGIRMALGASSRQAIREATRPALVLASAGIAVGCLLAALSTRVLKHLIWGITTTDPSTYATVAAVLLVVAAAASLAPALRITNMNPAETLREE